MRSMSSKHIIASSLSFDFHRRFVMRLMRRWREIFCLTCSLYNESGIVCRLPLSYETTMLGNGYKEVEAFARFYVLVYLPTHLALQCK